MDYEKKYQQALERAKKLKENPKAIFFEEKNNHVSDYIFPELRESEDEKVRKELIDAIQGLWDNDALPMPLSVKRKDEWLAWLEKQGG